jgi:2-amino-4-hydroxy-6-hydroxymethyldihydropteridine diphosphokinase
MQARVIVALGSNRRHGRYGAPRDIVRAAIAAMAAHGISVVATSRLHVTAPVGPSDRSFVNAAVVALTELAPPALLAELKAIERRFGRRRGRRWAARVLDLDIVAYGVAALPSRLRWRGARGLVVPHRSMHLRRFVLDPVAEVAPDWRHPVLQRSVRQLRARSKR